MDVQSNFFEEGTKTPPLSKTPRSKTPPSSILKRSASWWDQLPSLGDQLFVSKDAPLSPSTPPPSESGGGVDELSPLRSGKGLRRAKTSSPPPGFGTSPACHPEITGNDEVQRGGSDPILPPSSETRRVAAGNRLKRCVTFGTMPPNRTGSCERGEQDHLALRQMDGVEATPPENNSKSPPHGGIRLRRVNSSQIMRQAFPKTIFDNAEENLAQSPRTASGEMDTIASSMRAMLKVTAPQPHPAEASSEHEYKPVSPARGDPAITEGGHGCTGPVEAEGLERGDSWYNYQAKSWQRSNETLLEPAPPPSLVPPSQYPSPPQQPPLVGWGGAAAAAIPRGQQQQPAMPYPMPPFMMPPPVQAAGAQPGVVGQPGLAGPYGMLDSQQQQQQYLQWMYWSQMMNAAALAHGHAMPFPQVMPAAASMMGGGPGMVQQQHQHQQNRGPGGYSRQQQQQFRRGGGGRGRHKGGRGGGQPGDSYGRNAGGNASNDQQQSQSSLLTEHKATGRRVELSELSGHVVEFARDSHGSRFLQYKMETADDDGRQMLFDEVLPVAVELMNDVFGNYVVQNFLEHGGPGQCAGLIRTMRGHLLDLATQMHGCRVVQKALQVASPAQRRELVAELMPHTGHCARDPHATHVMQRIVVVVDSEQRAQLERATDAELIDLSVHPHACRFVQRVLGSKIDTSRPLVAAMMETITSNFELLSLDQHGNFILQHILDHGSPGQSAAVQSFVCDHVASFSTHKFASHLVEKCLMSATSTQRHALISAMLGSLQERDGELEETVLALMKDPYANFVVQKAYDVAEGRQRAAFSRGVLRHADKLNRFTYGRHILSHIGKSSPGGLNSSRSPTMPS